MWMRPCACVGGRVAITEVNFAVSFTLRCAVHAHGNRVERRQVVQALDGRRRGAVQARGERDERGAEQHVVASLGYGYGLALGAGRK